MINRYKIFFPVVMLLLITSCNDLLENDLPDNQVPSPEAIQTPEDLQELLNASYDVLANAFKGDNQRFAELLADNVNIIGNTGFLVQVYNRSSDFFNSDVSTFYKETYKAIVRANSVLENIDKLALSEAERNRFEGEAKFIRGISHFELVRLFGQPYGYTSDNAQWGIVIKTTSEIKPLTRNTVKEVYDLALTDLTDASTLLPETNGVYATKYSAHAYLAKMYFQMNDHANASANAETVINSGKFTFPPDINSRYGTEISPESVFSMRSTGVNDNRASLFKDMYRSINTTAPTLRTSDDYYTLINATAGDERAGWVEIKDYQTVTGVKVFNKFDADYMSVCLASLTEMMLIASESFAEQNTNLVKAEEYLNEIKDRAGVPVLSGATAETIILESRIERRKEFAGEGHRLHDLKRIGVSGESVVVRGAPWDCDGMVLQFPAAEQSIAGFEMNPQGGCN